MSKVSSKLYYHCKCVWPGIPKLPKLKSLIFLCNILRKCFLHADKHENLQQTDTMILMGIVKHLQSSKMTLGTKVSDKVISLLMSMMKHSQSSPINKFAISQKRS